MSKSTALVLLNKVLKNCGLPVVTGVSDLDAAETVCWDALNEAVDTIYGAERWQFAEEAYSLTMSSATRQYSASSTMDDFDKETFGNQYADDDMEFISPSQFFRAHPDQVEEQKGSPASVTYHKGKFFVVPWPDVNNHGSLIFFKGWKKPGVVATSTGTFGIPETYEESVLVNLATYKAMHYLGMAEAGVYYAKVYGSKESPDEEGSFNQMKRRYLSGDLQPVMDYIF